MPGSHRSRHPSQIGIVQITLFSGLSNHFNFETSSDSRWTIPLSSLRILGIISVSDSIDCGPIIAAYSGNAFFTLVSDILGRQPAVSNPLFCQIRSLVETVPVAGKVPPFTSKYFTRIGARPSNQDGERFLTMSESIKQSRHGACNSDSRLGVPKGLMIGMVN